MCLPRTGISRVSALPRARERNGYRLALFHHDNRLAEAAARQILRQLPAIAALTNRSARVVVVQPVHVLIAVTLRFGQFPRDTPPARLARLIGHAHFRRAPATQLR